jgi:hypothetical protein
MTGKNFDRLLKKHIYFTIENILKKYIDDDKDMGKARDEIITELNKVL